MGTKGHVMKGTKKGGSRHLNGVRNSVELGGVFLVGPVSSVTILCHFMHVGGPDLDLHGDPPWPLHCSVEGLVPRLLGVDNVVIVLSTHLPPQAVDGGLDPAQQIIVIITVFLLYLCYYQILAVFDKWVRGSLMLYFYYYQILSPSNNNKNEWVQRVA